MGGDFSEGQQAKLMDAGRAASTAKKPTAAKKPVVAKKPSPAKPAAVKKPAAARKTSSAKKQEKSKEQPKRQLRFERHDVVRFRKRSQIATGLGIREGTEFTVEMMGTHDEQPSVVLRVGDGRHSAFIRVPPGHLALVRSADQVPKEIKACTARLARYEGPLSSTTRRLLAELARSA